LPFFHEKAADRQGHRIGVETNLLDGNGPVEFVGKRARDFTAYQGRRDKPEQNADCNQDREKPDGDFARARMPRDAESPLTDLFNR